MGLAPTPQSILRNVLQALRGLLELSQEDEAFVTIPRFYLVIWQEQLTTILRLLRQSHP
jgi:hypothetical protein